jgi:hypothetical protein
MIVDTTQIPLAQEHTKELVMDLKWHDFQWGDRSLTVKDIEIDNLLNYKFYGIKR